MSKRILFITVIFLISILLTKSCLAEEVILGEDSRLLFPSDLSERYIRKLPVDKEGKTIAPVIPQSPVLFEKGERKITKIEIVSVIPVTGNNPINPQDPINNAMIDGKLYFTAVDELEELLKQQQQQQPGGCYTCSNSYYSHTEGINFFINPSTNKCSLNYSGGIGGYGELEGFDVAIPLFCDPYDKVGNYALLIQTNPATNFRLVQLPQDVKEITSEISWAIPIGLYEIVLKQTTTGNQWKVQLVIGMGPYQGPGEFVTCRWPVERTYSKVPNLTVEIKCVTPLQ